MCNARSCGLLRRSPLWMMLCVVLSLFGACSKADRHRGHRLNQLIAQGPTPAQKAQLQDAMAREVLSKLAIARSHHQRATIFHKTGQSQQALAELDSILALQFPRNYQPAEEMLLDTWARKATLLLELRQPKRALTTIQEAIKRPSSLKHSFYIAHLHHVRGRILDALQRPKDALQAFQTSIEINKAVILDAQRQQKRLAAPLAPPRSPVHTP